MQIIPKGPVSLKQLAKNYINEEDNLEGAVAQADGILDKLKILAGEDSELVKTLHDTLTSVEFAHDHMVSEPSKSRNDETNSIFTTISSATNGLEIGQKQALLGSLNQVQKAWTSFVNTVSTVFGVKTEPTTT